MRKLHIVFSTPLKVDIFKIDTHIKYDSSIKGSESLNVKKAILSGFIGALSTIPSEIITRILVMLGIGKYDVYQLNSLVTTINEPSILLGMIINFVIGGFVAALLYTLLEMINRQFIIIINIATSLLVWFVFESAFTVFFEGILSVSRPESDHYVHLIATTVYGITQGVLFKTIIFRKKDNVDEE